jgi:hypothetical protein
MAFARFFQGRADPIQEEVAAVFRIRGAVDAWSLGELLELRAVNWQTAALVLGSTIVLAWLALREPVERRAVGGAVAAVYGLLLPGVFGVLVSDVLDLRQYSYRFFVVFFAPMIIGLALAAVDRSRLAVLTTAAAVIAIGFSGPSIVGRDVGRLRPLAPKVWEAPANWPGGNDAADADEESADRLLAATPEGGRFLATKDVEGIATARSTDRFPTYVREQFIRSFDIDAGTPPEFRASQRRLLEAAVNGRRGPERTVEELIAALDEVEIDAVCAGPDTSPALEDALAQTFQQTEQAPSCVIWTRGGP